MRERLGLHRHSLTVQMIVSYVALALLTAVATGLPAIWLIQGQIEQQAWAQVDQGSRATQALYLAWQSKITDLATLTSQRPTLQTLLAQDNQDALPVYLQTLQTETELDLLLVCDDAQNLVAQAGAIVSSPICTLPQPAGFYHLDDAVWLLDSHAVSDETNHWGQVVAGIALGEAFARQMFSQTGLEHTLFLNGQPLVSSLPDTAVNTRHSAAAPITDVTDPSIFEQNGRSYYAARIPLDKIGPTNGLHLDDDIALDVTDIVATQRRLIWILSASIGLVALVGSALGLFLARRIGRPLAHLADAAVTFRLGNLDQPVAIQAGIYEVSLTAQALEQARAELQKTIAELRRAKAWSDHLLESIVEGIVTLDDDGRITFFSPGAERITGLHQAAVLSHHTDAIFQLADGDAPFSQHLPLPGKRSTVILQFPDQSQKTIAVTAARITPPAATQRGMALVLRDVSETEIIHRFLGEFLANITHEFRTPLTALAVSAEILLEQAPELNPDELQELLVSLHLGILNLQTLIDNLLESARLEAGHFRVQPRPSDLGEIVAEAVQVMQPLQIKYNQRLTIELPTAVPNVQADMRRVVQVLVNLLSNAIRHNPDHSEIIIGVKVQDDWAQVTVTDQGPGVPASYRADLFRPFTHPSQPDVPSRHGAGLGLSVVKAIVEAHGGQVGLRDGAGGGAAFWFTLPLAKNIPALEAA